MGVWTIGLLVILVALTIPLLAIVLDSSAIRTFLEARQGRRGIDKNLHGKVEALEEEVQELQHAFKTLREETQFIQRLLENPAHRESQETRSPDKS